MSGTTSSASTPVMKPRTIGPPRTGRMGPPVDSVFTNGMRSARRLASSSVSSVEPVSTIIHLLGLQGLTLDTRGEAGRGTRASSRTGVIGEAD